MKKMLIIILFVLLNTNSFAEKQSNVNDMINFLEKIN